MSHARIQIRDALVLLLGALTTTGANVFTERPETFRIADNRLPALLVTLEGEELQALQMSFPPLIEHRLDVVLVGVAKAAADVHETLDAIYADVDAALFASTTTATLTARLKNLEWTRIDPIELDATLEKPVGRIWMRLTATYHTAAGAPQTLL